ncbi:MAG: hypothetical protein GWN77_09275, partial [Gammaproteobacteria bacterium]|nr:hypothetical protein [Gammaproteobacteria bacterium]
RFWLATEESRAHYKSPVIGALRDKAARGDVQASKTILASSDKETWGDNIRLEQEIEKVIK